MFPLVFAILFPAFVHLHLIMSSILIMLFHSAGAADASHDDEEQADDAQQADDAGKYLHSQLFFIISIEF